MGSEGSNEFEGEAGAPGASSKGEYVLFIEELDKLNFNEIYVENITWHTSNLVASGSGNNLVLYKECFKVLNELEFTKTSEDNIDFNYWLIVNGDWCTIYIGEHNYIALEYDNNYYVYETNSDNVYELLKDILK